MRRAVLILLAATALLAGCGGDDDDGGQALPVADQKAKTELTEIDTRLRAQGAKIFEELKKRKPNDPITADVKSQTQAYADAEDKAAKQLLKLKAPPDAAADVKKWAAGLRSQAKALREAVSKPGVTGEQLTSTILSSSPQDGVNELRATGYLPPPE